MAKQFSSTTAQQARASKIQVEVKEITRSVVRKNTSARLDVDSDGGDFSNE